jgi:hypothetical protein
MPSAKVSARRSAATSASRTDDGYVVAIARSSGVSASATWPSGRDVGCGREGQARAPASRRLLGAAGATGRGESRRKGTGGSGKPSLNEVRAEVRRVLRQRGSPTRPRPAYSRIACAGQRCASRAGTRAAGGWRGHVSRWRRRLRAIALVGRAAALPPRHDGDDRAAVHDLSNAGMCRAVSLHGHDSSAHGAACSPCSFLRVASDTRHDDTDTRGRRHSFSERTWRSYRQA